jgi:hypothetical protein
VKNNPRLVALLSLAIACACSSQAQTRKESPMNAVVRCESAGHDAQAIAAWESMPHDMLRSGIAARCAPFAALAYERDGQPDKARTILENLANVLRARSNYLVRLPAARVATLQSIADCAPRFTDTDCRTLCADMLARAQAQAGDVAQR